MARTKEFDPDVALRAAIDLFWRKGYEATSMQDLVDELGIGRASIYATFGNKHQLYATALARYSEQVGARVMERLSQPGPALPQVRELVRWFEADALADLEGKGCLVTNTVVEFPSADREMSRLTEANLDTLEAALAMALTRARHQGELVQGKDPVALARFLITLIQGIRVIAKTSDKRRLGDAVDQALTVLA